MNDFRAGRQSEFRGNLEMARAVAGTLNMFVQDVLHQELSIGVNFIYASVPPGRPDEPDT